jgi:UTP pyrophosphatase
VLAWCDRIHEPGLNENAIVFRAGKEQAPSPPMGKISPMSSSPRPTGELHLPYLQGYPHELLVQVREMIKAGRLAQTLAQRHHEAHDVRTERALYAYVNELKSSHMKSAPPLAKVAYDPKLHIMNNVLGTHSTVSRVQGGRLKAKREIRIATLFKEAPADFLRMIVVHELAHLKEREHGKAFYALCLHMAPDYHQLEFDLRLWLTAQELGV